MDELYFVILYCIIDKNSHLRKLYIFPHLLRIIRIFNLFLRGKIPMSRVKHHHFFAMIGATIITGLMPTCNWLTNKSLRKEQDSLKHMFVGAQDVRSAFSALPLSNYRIVSTYGILKCNLRKLHNVNRWKILATFMTRDNRIYIFFY